MLPLLMAINLEPCVLHNILNANTKHAELVVHSLIQPMKLLLLEFRIQGESLETAALNLSRLSWTGMYMDVYTPSTQLECIYHLHVEDRRNTVHMRNNLIKCHKDV